MLSLHAKGLCEPMRHLLKIQRYILFATITKVVATITKLLQDKVFLTKAFSRPNFFEPKLNPVYPSFKLCEFNFFTQTSASVPPFTQDHYYSTNAQTNQIFAFGRYQKWYF